jgi:hypothetical protein
VETVVYVLKAEEAAQVSVLHHLVYIAVIEQTAFVQQTEVQTVD